MLAVFGFIGLFAEYDGIGGQLLLTACALAVFAAGVALLGGFKKENNTTLNTIANEQH